MKLPKKGALVAIDTETKSLTDKTMVGFSVAFGNRSEYFPVRDKILPNISIDNAKEILSHVLQNCHVVFHNSSFDLPVIHKFGVEIPDKLDIDDTVIMANLVNENMLHGLKKLTKKYFDYQMTELKELTGSGKNRKSFDEVEDIKKINYAKDDAKYTLKLYYKLKSLLDKDEASKKVYEEIERPLLQIIALMHIHGVRVNVEKVLEIGKMCFDKMNGAEEKLRILMGQKINFNSTKQLREYFIGERRLPVLKKTPKGEPSVDKEVLEQYAEMDGSAKLLLEYRKYSKIYSTFIPAMTPTNWDEKTMTGLIYTSFNQAGTVSGRFSSSRPNMQNIPRKDEIGLRAVVIPDEGDILIGADYSQIELRVLAHFSQDQNLLYAYNNKKDIHQQTADALGLDRYDAKCFHPFTEVLTPNGWKCMCHLNTEDKILQAYPYSNFDVRFEWVKPKLKLKKHPSKTLIHLKNEGVDLRVTPEHRMLYYSNYGYPHITKPKCFNSVRYWMNSGILHNCISCDENLLRLAIATQGDGSYKSFGIQFGFSKKRKVNRLKKLLKNFDGLYTITIDKNKIVWFNLWKELADKIKPYLDNKKLSWSMLNYSIKYKYIILEEAKYWDSHCRKNWQMFRYSSKEEQNVDVLQALAATSNFKTRKVRKKDGMFDLTIRKNNKSRGGNIKITNERYTKKVAFLSVPSTYVLVRDGGIPIITGQTINFGLVYGMGAKTLGKKINKSYDDAQKYIDAYFRTYPMVQSFWKKAERDFRTLGYVQTFFGRKRRRTPYFFTKDDYEQGGEVRSAINSVIQGSAADLMKIAMKNMAPKLKPLGAKLILTVHDEILVSCPIKNAVKAKKIIESEMIKAGKDLSVLIEVDCKFGRTWAEAHGEGIKLEEMKCN